MKTFLKPLTSEEEKYYLQEYKRGSQEAKNILIERNLRLVAHIVKKYQGIEEDLDDLISIGTIGLIKAIHTFDQKKSNRLSTYAARSGLRQLPLHKTSCKIAGSRLNSGFFIAKTCQFFEKYLLYVLCGVVLYGIILV